MPACRECKHFNKEDVQCKFAILTDDMSERDKVKLASRACLYAILQKHAPSLHGEIIEIGFGVSRSVRNAVRKKGHWRGVDIKYQTADESRLVGSAEHIPVEDGSINWVIAFETMEHWYERGESVPGGLKEIRRILKPGGKLLCTMPIHQHGEDPFILGNLRTLKWWFKRGWQKVQFEEWRREHDPLPKLEEWVQKHRDRMESGIGKVPSMWKLEVLATK